MDVEESTLRHWVQQLMDEHEGFIPKGKALTPEQRRTQGLKAQVNRLFAQSRSSAGSTADSDAIAPISRSPLSCAY